MIAGAGMCSAQSRCTDAAALARRGPRQRATAGPPAAAGFGLAETMVAMTIAVIALAAAATLYSRARLAQRAIDARTRMQETALVSLALIESDLRMAGYLGLARPGQAAAINGALVAPNRCGGITWIEPTRFVDGANDGGFAVPNCNLSGGGLQPGTDLLLVRRASADALSVRGGLVGADDRDRILLASRLGQSELFVASPLGGRVPAGFDNTPGAPAEIRSWLVHAYYISRGSSAGAAVPGLRRKTLQSGPAVGDEELATGIEDLQLLIGADVDGDGVVDASFVPGSLPPESVPRWVQVCLRLRSAERDDAAAGTSPGAAADSCAGQRWPPVADGRSRFTIGKTIALRNAG